MKASVKTMKKATKKLVLRVSCIVLAALMVFGTIATVLAVLLT